MLRISNRDRWFIDRVLPHAAAYHRQAMRWAIDADAAGEIVQEAYTRIIALPHWAGVIAPKAYMMLLVRNIGIDRLRHARVVPFDKGGDAALFDVADDAPDAFDQLAARRELDAVRQAVAGLPPKCRQVVEMRKFEEISPPEIAERLGISVSTVEKHLVKGMRIVMEAIGSARGEDGGRNFREEQCGAGAGGSRDLAGPAGRRIG